MKRKLWVLLIVSILGLGGLSSCISGVMQSAESPLETPADLMTPSATPVAIEPTPTIQGPNILYFQVPEQVQVGSITEVPLMLVGGGDIAELSVDVLFPIFFLQVVDDDPDVAGTQVKPGPLPESALLEVNAVDDAGVLHYKVTGLGVSETFSRTILTLRMNAVAVSHEIVQLEFQQVVLLGPDGAFLSVASHPALVEVVAAGVVPGGDAGPTPTPEPAVQTPAPTPVAPTPVVSTPAPPSTGIGEHIQAGIYYRVQDGQTLYRIATVFGSTADAIAAENGIEDVTNVPVGTLIRIPVMPPVGQAAYFVPPRDNLYRISRTFDLSVEDLAAINNIVPPYTLEAGRWIILRP